MLNITRYSIRDRDLIPWVKFIWHFDMKDADLHNKLLPTDCIDLILNLGSDLHYEIGRDTILAPQFHVNGLRSGPSFVHQTGTIHLWGISFYSYGLFPFIQTSVRCLQDQVMPLAALSLRLTEKLATVTSDCFAEERNMAIERVLREELSVTLDFLEKTKLIADFLASDNKVGIQTFCREQAVSIKSFERMTLRYTGFSPKALRIRKRFQAASNPLAHGNRENLLASIAYHYCFADQAHFTKEFKRFSGTTPLLFQKEKASVKENANYCYR